MFQLEHKQVRLEVYKTIAWWLVVVLLFGPFCVLYISIMYVSLPISSHSPFVIKLEVSPALFPSFNSKSSCK